MSIFNTFYGWYLRSRIGQIEMMMQNPYAVQERVLGELLEKMRDTAFGKQYEFRTVKNISDLRNRVPVQNYDGIKIYIDRMMQGEENVLWPGDINWFAKSSGTTSDKSKFIPISYESLEYCHLAAAKDILTIYCENFPETNIFSGKGLVMGGSHQVNSFNEFSYYGDLSAVIMQNLPFWVHFIRTPDLSVALMSDWEGKIEKMARQTMMEDVTNISGVPTWTLILIERIFQISGKSDLHDVWPNLELYIHGGVSFIPYRERFEKLFPKKNINYLETYNASEGFFGLQNDTHSNDLLLMLDYGIYYEFMPMKEYGKEFPETKLLHEINIGEIYALVITTNAGLCRYLPGDTIRFTSTKPYKFLITGRTKHFINAFGEEVIIENAEKALEKACKDTHATIRDYTAAPIYISDDEKPSHQWVIEFENQPDDLNNFTKILDNTLKEINSDYEAKRYKDIAMQLPKIISAEKGTFNKWLQGKEKLGGQHKVPRLCNDRKVMDEILGLLPQKNS